MTNTIDNLSFDYADHKIKQLIDQLEIDGVCGWCVGRALTANGMDLLVATTSPREAIATLRELALSLLADAPIPGCDASQR